MWKNVAQSYPKKIEVQPDMTKHLQQKQFQNDTHCAQEHDQSSEKGES